MYMVLKLRQTWPQVVKQKLYYSFLHPAQLLFI